VEWRVGTVEKAKLFAASANAAHGLRRTAGDRRRAIEMVLSTAEGARWTQEEIATHCKVTQQYVSKVLGEYNSCNPPKNPPPAKPTKAEQKRACIVSRDRRLPISRNRRAARSISRGNPLGGKRSLQEVRSPDRTGCHDAAHPNAVAAAARREQ
jgi:hypothetical protein